MGTQPPQLSNEVSSGMAEQPNDLPTKDNPEKQQQITGTSFYCNEEKHQAQYSGTRLRELAQDDPRPQSLANKGHNVHTPRTHRLNWAKKQNSFVRLAATRDIPLSRADTEKQTRVPREASHTNARIQMKTEA